MIINTNNNFIIAPVCTTELGLVAALQDEWAARNVNVIGLSANGLAEHEKWIADINEISHVELDFPIIADADRKISTLYDMLDHQVSFCLCRKRDRDKLTNKYITGCYQR